MTAGSENPVLYYIRTIRRQRWTIALMALLGAGAALGVVQLQHPVYQAQAQILLQPAQTPSAIAGVSSASSQLSVPDEIQRLQSAPVADAVRSKLGSAPAMSVSQVTGTDAIDVTVKSSSPAFAARAANAYAQSYLTVRQAQAQSAVETTLNALQNQLRNVQQQVLASGGNPNALPAAGAAQTGVSPQLAALEQSEATLSQQIQTLQLAADLSSAGAEVIQPATAPTSPVSPRPVRDGLMGFGGGLVLGLGLAFLREQMDETMATKEDLAAAQGNLPVLGVVPAFPSGRKAKGQPAIITAAHPNGVVSEAYRQVRTALQFLTLERPAQLIQVTSPRTAEGKSTLVANLAVIMAQSGHRVVAVDCDLRRPRMHDLFSLDDEQGFSSVLLGELSIGAALQKVDGIENLQVLVAGKRPPNPAELLGSRQAAQAIESLRGYADTIIVDSPPVIPVTDAVVLSTKMDATVLVAMSEVTTRRDLGQSLEQLSQVGAPVVGAVLNRVAAHSDYGYRYGYAYAYGAPPEPARRS